jgi:hypothetical protein
LATTKPHESLPAARAHHWLKAGLIKRIGRLESNKSGPSFDEKNAVLIQRTLAALSDQDLELLEQVALLQAADRENECTAEQIDAALRYDEAYVKALSESNVKFTINEMDQMLGAE